MSCFQLLGVCGDTEPPYPPPQPPRLWRQGTPKRSWPKPRGYLRLFRVLWQGGHKVWPAAYGAGFVNFLPLQRRWRRGEAGDSAGTGAWSENWSRSCGGRV